MPSYDYQCLKCKKSFTLTMAITEHGTKKVRCPSCKSTRVQQRLSTFFAQTSKKS
jgi:putative FmdB family regulatory protein